MTTPASGRDQRLEHVLRELDATRLSPVDWAAVDDLLEQIESGHDVIDQLTTLLFEAKVRTRFSGQRASASLPPTKQTSILPLVGVVCGGLLVGVGALLGGGVILAGIVALGVFVFGIAFAGSRVAHRDEPGTGDEETVAVEPMPAEVTRRVATLRR